MDYFFSGSYQIDSSQWLESFEPNYQKDSEV